MQSCSKPGKCRKKWLKSRKGWRPKKLPVVRAEVWSTLPATGKGDILSITIENELISPEDKEMLQDLITAAANDAIRKARELGKQEMAGLTGGMQIPGLGNLL